MTGLAAAGRPERGTRPANRRALILAAAAGLIASRGYENTGVSDIAASVAVGPSALYRHFPSKDTLLEAVIEQVTAECAAALSAAPVAAPGGAGALRALAAFALDHRAAGVLWQREARYLPPPAFAAVRSGLDDLRDQVAARIGGEEGTAWLRAGAALAVLFSPSFHHVELDRPAFDELLGDLAAEAARGPVALPAIPPAAGPAPRGMARAARREQILQAAMSLFAERTYAGVGMDDVAAAAAMAPSSVYHHFPGKVDILVTALRRADGYLQLALTDILARADGEAAALGALVASYAGFAVRHPDLVDILITQARGLPAPETAAIAAAQRDYVEEWVRLYQAVHPGTGRPAARVAVHAALMLVNDLARGGLPRSWPDAPGLLTVLAARVLRLPPA